MKFIDWSEEIERLEENEEISDMQESPEGLSEEEMLMVMVKKCDDWDKEEMGFISKKEEKQVQVRNINEELIYDSEEKPKINKWQFNRKRRKMYVIDKYEKDLVEIEFLEEGGWDLFFGSPEQGLWPL